MEKIPVVIYTNHPINKLVSAAFAKGFKGKLVHVTNFNDFNNRENFTELDTITIDPDSARDYDDALSLSQNENGSFFLQRLDFNIEILNYSRIINPTVMFRKLFLPIILFYIFILPFFSRKLFFQKLYFGHIFKLKEVVFLWLASVIGLIFLINLIYK